MHGYHRAVATNAWCAEDRVLVGTAPTVVAEFRDIAGDLADPVSITVIVQAPDGSQDIYTVPTPEITNPSVGVWYFTWPAPVTTAGDYWVYVSGIGNSVTVANQIMVSVFPSEVTLP